MNAFAIDWLRQREPLDLAARDPACTQRFVAALVHHAHRPLRLLDLASGSGASFRALAPLIGVDQVWTLTDHDEHLLAAQQTEIACWAASTCFGQGAHCIASASGVGIHAGHARWTAQGLAVDLQRDLDSLDFCEYDGVTTSAFLDLVSAAWIEAFARKLVASRRPLLAVLSVDGRRHWQPASRGDADMLMAFAAHQARDKGFGAALGTEAAGHLARMLEAACYDVTLARSDWHVDAEHDGMLDAMIADEVHAAGEAHPRRRDSFERWAALRREQLARRELSLHVGHLDLLALPPSS